MLEVVSMPKMATNSKIMLIVYFFSLTTKESILLLAKLIGLASKVALEVYIDNVIAFAMNKSSTKI